MLDESERRVEYSDEEDSEAGNSKEEEDAEAEDEGKKEDKTEDEMEERGKEDEENDAQSEGSWQGMYKCFITHISEPKNSACDSIWVRTSFASCRQSGC